MENFVTVKYNVDTLYFDIETNIGDISLSEKNSRGRKTFTICYCE